MVIGRFLGVGLACAALHNVIMIAGDVAGLHYAASSVISLFVVTTFGYHLHSRWTFSDASRGRTSFMRYFATVSANFPLSLLGLFVFVDLIGVSVPAASIAVTVILFVFNFTAIRWALRLRRSGVTR